MIFEKSTLMQKRFKLLSGPLRLSIELPSFHLLPNEVEALKTLVVAMT